MSVSKFYTKAEEAIKRKNYDLAVEMLKNQILKFNPNDVKARKLLRATILEKHKNNGTPSQADVFIKGLVPQFKMGFGKALKKWDMVVEEAENFLLHDPKNIGVLYKLGEACIEANYIDTAISVFENVLALDRSHMDSLKQLGRIYDSHKEDLEKAQHYYQRAYKLDKTDAEAEKAMKGIAARITSSSYSQAKSSQDLIKDKDKAKELEEDQAILRTDDDIKRAIERTKSSLKDKPDDKKNLRKLGELYQKLQKFDDAVSTYEQVLKLDSTSFDIKCKISDCKLQKIAGNIKAVKAQYQKTKNEALKGQLKKLQKQKIVTEIEEYKMQVKEQPTNHDIRYKLGVALYTGGRYDDAIAAFQHAVKDPRIKTSVVLYMGQAFVKKKEYTLAEEQFKSVISELTDKDPKYKEVLYQLGVCLEAAGQTDKAISTYTNIYKVDIQFKDVGDRLKKLKG